jgi:hypothetical protein
MSIEQTQTDSDKLFKELEDGYKANYDYYRKCQEEWKYADSEITLSL